MKRKFNRDTMITFSTVHTLHNIGFKKIHTLFIKQETAHDFDTGIQFLLYSNNQPSWIDTLKFS